MLNKRDPPRPEDHIIAHHVEPWKILEAKEKGCQSCRLLSQAMDIILRDYSYEGSITSSNMRDSRLHIDRDLYHDRRLRIYLWAPRMVQDLDGTSTNKVWTAATSYEVFTTPGPSSRDSLWSAIGYGRLISDEALSSERTSMMKMWLESCLRDHPECQSTFSTRPTLLPDRVLFVRSNYDIRLHVNIGKDIGRYAALSHCWGGQIALQTTRKTIGSFQNDIPFHTLPKSFQDAVMVCRALEIDYLWIDSLCIIQDSKDDWTEQAFKMYAGYSNSFVTIAADAAQNSTCGFLPTQVGKDRTPEKAHELESCCNEKKVYMRMAGKLATGCFCYHSWGGSKKTFLESRGWALQETILPRRVLHFAAEEVAWQCECQHENHPREQVEGRNEKLLFNSRPFDLKRNWDLIVREYSSRSFSRDSDRLIAFAGIASRAQQYCPNVRYLPGMWEDGLLRSLLWSTEQLAYYSSKRVNPRIAPSWSWTSITGAVTTVESSEKDLYPKIHGLSASLHPSVRGMEYHVGTGANITFSGLLFHVTSFREVNMSSTLSASISELIGIMNFHCICQFDNRNMSNMLP
ncbi:hypothetical protein M426DRAFT_10983 [Hypoxylon sp. CI-4A]|nr:hypothetical protein M426DRAFT_10983 [Hypoxylon sp. CI-4A]